ncbi:hypothetical protein JAAARDRAFT_129474 [Jaapia argillacea MUCL 33604]|uniref:Uncharacterized protein n=1 Tax=Jaapia argillacea MUCL 33604 TaxID=933084 RepID=A0A067PTI9_9AGAM|nr:hypothetical protein JAAARDRAFT_129474 [Jaapia argillacea MUCL 33604]
MTRNTPKSTQAKSGTSAPKKGNADDDVKKTRVKPVEWNEHPEWTNKAIAYLIQFPAFCIKLFSNSTLDANKDGWRKLTAKDPKNQLYAELAKAVFENNEDEEIRNEYTQDIQQFGRSTQLHFRQCGVFGVREVQERRVVHLQIEIEEREFSYFRKR